LRTLPGVQVYESSPGHYTVSLRGTGGVVGNNTIVLVDGIPVNSPLDGAVAWELMPVHVEDVERVEIVRGPVSTIYGANAYTGVISIVTYRGFGRGPYYGVRARGGADGELSPFGNVSGRYVLNDKGVEQGFFINGTYDATHQNSEGESVEHTPLSAGTALGRATFIFGTSSLALEAGGGFARGSSLEHLVLDVESEKKGAAFGAITYRIWDLPSILESAQVWARGNTLMLRAKASDYTGFSYAGTDGVRTSAGLDVELAPASMLRITGSGALLLDWIDAPYLHPNVQGAVRVGYAAGLGAVLDPLQWLTLSLAGRAELPPVSGELRFAYRASAVVHRDSWAVRLAAGRAFRAPTYVEAGGRFTDPRTGHILLEGEPRIDAPTNDAFELGATVAPTRTISLGATTYFSRLSNVMVEDFEPLVRKTYITDPESRDLVGLELEGTWRFRDGFRYRGAFTYLHWLDSDSELVPLVGDPQQNAEFVASSGADGTFRNETFGYGLTATLSTQRRYQLRTGIPPQILERTIDPQVHLTAMVEQYLGDHVPLWLSLRVQSNLMSAVESPLPQAGVVGTRALLGLEVRK
jgi:outer membrane receptor protein involved in Fe transport